MAQGTTRYVIAKRSGIDHTTLSKFLRGDGDCRLSTVDAIADFLGLELQPKKARKGPK